MLASTMTSMTGIGQDREGTEAKGIYTGAFPRRSQCIDDKCGSTLQKQFKATAEGQNDVQAQNLNDSDGRETKG